jgi:hypothetical protein
MNESTLSLIRAVLKIGGGYLIAKNLASGNDVDAIISGILALVGVIWGMYAKKPAPVPVPVPVPVPTPVPTPNPPVPVMPPPARPILMKKIISLLATVALVGCTNVSAKRTLADGSELGLHAGGLLSTVQGLKFSVKDEKGFGMSLSATKEGPDVQAINAVGSIVTTLASRFPMLDTNSPTTISNTSPIIPLAQ